MSHNETDDRFDTLVILKFYSNVERLVVVAQVFMVFNVSPARVLMTENILWVSLAAVISNFIN